MPAHVLHLPPDSCLKGSCSVVVDVHLRMRPHWYCFLFSIHPSAIVDIVRIRCLYDGLEIGLGTRFQDYIFGEIDKLEDNAGIDEVHFGYYRALANRFHQSIYYKIDGDDVTVWRVLDQRFNPRRIESALTSPNDDE